MANQPEKAMDWLEKGFELHDPTMTYIATKIFNLESLFNNPRFLSIVKKMNLPLPKNDRLRYKPYATHHDNYRNE
jgi:hypothetical protein